MLKRVFRVVALMLFVVTLFGCAKVTDDDLPRTTETISVPQAGHSESQPEPAESQPSNTEETEPHSRYKISATSSIESDFDYFGIGMEPAKDALALSDLCAIFPDEEQHYLYFKIPEDTEHAAYRIDTMRINGVEYELQLLEVDGSYQKYAVADWRLDEDNTYEISEIHFYNEKNSADKQTYNTTLECIVFINDEQYYFQQEHRYHITLEGTLFESVYQFNKDKNAFQDLWNNLIAKPSGLDEDDRSFFYFAFNCYDTDREIKFTPSEILQLEVEYNQLTYAYEGKDKNQAENITPMSKKSTEVITPDDFEVTSNSKYSNKKIYKYNTINRLDDATLERNKNAENAKTLEYAARSYDWAVQFGDRYGYSNRRLEAGWLFGKTYDVLYTQIEDFKAIHIVYRYDGKKFDLDTDSLIADEPVTVPEVVIKPTPKEKEEHNEKVIIDDPELTRWEKFIELVKLKFKPNWKTIVLIVIVVIVLAVVLVIRIRFGRIFRNKRLSSAVKELIQDRDSDALEEIIEDVIDQSERDDD